MGDKPDDLPLQFDLMAIAGHATAQYGLDDEEIAASMRAAADCIEGDDTIRRLYVGANEVPDDG